MQFPEMRMFTERRVSYVATKHFGKEPEYLMYV